MKKLFAKTAAKTWSKVAQTRELDRKSSPATPRPIEVAVFRRYLKKITPEKRDLKMLILGATPELRDLGIALGYEVLAADFSMDMINVLTSVMKYQGHQRNLIIKGNWLEMDRFFKQGIFDVIMGDAPFNNVLPKDYRKLFLIVKELLKPEGCLIIRQMVVEFSSVKEAEEIERMGQQKRMDWIELFFSIYLGSSKNRIWYSRKTKLVDISKFSYWVENHISEVKSPVKELYKKMVGKMRKGAYHSVLPRKELENLIKKYFAIIKIEKPLNLGLTPIYLLRKK